MRNRRKPKIDVVPLIDVLMILIIFFLVTMQFRDLRALNVKLPKIETAGSNLIKNELIISITEGGDFFANSKPVTLERLTSLLRVASTMDIKPAILVVADENVPLKKLPELLTYVEKMDLRISVFNQGKIILKLWKKGLYFFLHQL